MEKKINYESAITNLENIVKQLEQGEVSLEKSIDLFTEGMNLVKLCNQYLDQAEEKIKVLVDDKIEEISWSKED